MKKIYLNNSSNVWKVITSFAMVLTLSMMVSTAFGQITWKGTVDTDASKPENWSPAGDYHNQTLVIDTAQATIWPRFTSARLDTVIAFTMSARSEITIAKPDTSVLQMNMPGKDQFYMGGFTINIESGKFRTKNSRNFYLEDSLAFVKVTGTGYFQNPGLTAMGKVGTQRGGHIEISDNGTFETGDMIRFLDYPTKSTITITDNGKFILHKDYRTEIQKRINTGQIRSDADHDINLGFDVGTTTITLTTRSKDALVAFPSEAQNIIAGDEMATANALVNRGYESLTNAEWKYSTTSGSGYQSFSTPLKGDTVKFTFDEPGTYYVVFQGTKTDASVGTSNEVTIVAAPAFVKLNLTDTQFLRKGQTGATIACLDQVSITSREWKYSKTSGTGYKSFADAITGIEYTPSFDTTGVYYVVCQYVYNGATNTTKEIMINVDNHTFPITWTGAVSDDAGDIRNWNPMAHVQWMTLIVPAESTVVPHLRGAVNDTINYINGNFIIEKEDTAIVNFRQNDWYLSGTVTVNSGIVELNKSTRLTSGNAIFTLNNNSVLRHLSGWLIMGNSSASTNGGRINMSGNAKLELSATSNDVWRWVVNNDSLSSVHISGNAVITMPGNFFNNYSSLVETGDIFTDEGSEVVVNYNETDNITSIYTRSASSFGLADYSDVVIGVGMPASALSTINNETVLTYNWKYTKTPGSGYVAFDTLQTESTFAPIFSEAGLYYVVCQGFDGTALSTTDEVKILAVSINVAPADTQYLQLLAEGLPLSVSESTVADTREWKVTTTSGSGYESIFPPATGLTYTPIFIEGNGTYYVVCESMVQGTPVVSNEVMFVVGTTGVRELDNDLLTVYPNPANNRFYVNASARSFDLSICDLTGRIVLQRNYKNVLGDQSIDFNQKGVFIVKVKFDDKIIARKIIMQ